MAEDTQRAGQPDQGGGGGQRVDGGPKTYSDRLKTNVKFSQRLSRNILEITLEKTNKGVYYEIEDENISKVLKTLGIDIVSQFEGYQIKQMGTSSLISVWLKAGLGLDKYCKDISIRVNDNVTTGLIRPAGKKDVTVTVIGLDFNTPDTFVIEYLNKFGVVVNKAVIYSKFESGPFKGKFNGERKYQVDFSDSTQQMGTCNLVDGCKVRVFYR